MSAIILDRARDALVLGEKKPSVKMSFGNLQSHKVVPLSFYLCIGGAVLSAIAAVALTVAAISLSIFTLYIAVLALSILSVVGTLAAFSIYFLSPEKELHSLIGDLSAKIRSLYKENQTLKVNLESARSIPVQVTEPVNVNLTQELEEQKRLVANFKESLIRYSQLHEEDKNLLKDNLKILGEFLREKNVSSDESQLQIDEVFQSNNFENIDLIFEKLQSNRRLYQQMSVALPLLIMYTRNVEEERNHFKTNWMSISSEVANLDQPLQPAN